MHCFQVMIVAASLISHCIKIWFVVTYIRYEQDSVFLIKNSKGDTLTKEDALKQLPSIISAIFCSKLAHHEKKKSQGCHMNWKKKPNTLVVLCCIHEAFWNLFPPVLSPTVLKAYLFKLHFWANIQYLPNCIQMIGSGFKKCIHVETWSLHIQIYMSCKFSRWDVVYYKHFFFFTKASLATH